MKTNIKETLSRELKPFRSPALFVMGYWLLKTIFSYAADNQGLLSPSGSVNAGFALLALAVLGLRLLVIFLVPTMMAYRIGVRIHAAFAR